MIFRNLYKKIAASIILLAFVLGSVLSSYPVTAQAAINKMINYQGKLTNASNLAVTDGLYNMEFKLYTQLSGGAAIWTETLTTTNRVQVTNGLFSVMLGSTTALTGVDFNQTLYLGVNVESDGEMAPRKILGAVPAAFVADTLDNLSSEQFLRSDASNSTSTASTFLTFVQSGAGKIAEFFGQASASVLSLLSNGNVGIGTTTPYAKLSVAGQVVGEYFTATSTTATSTFAGGLVAGNGSLNVLQNGNVGIGSTTPAEKLTVHGNVLIAASTGGAKLTVRAGDGQSSTNLFEVRNAANTNLMRINAAGAIHGIDGSVGIPGFSFLNDTDTGMWRAGDDLLAFSTASVERLRIDASGNIGIGTTSPYAKLSVVGEVVASHFTATSTATSTFGGSLAVTEVATSSFAGGINLTAGCFSINNTCVGGSTSGSSFAYLFPSNATSTRLAFNGGLTSFASTTIGNGTEAGGLTISGGATTTGNAYFGGNVGIGTTSSSIKLSLNQTSAASTRETLVRASVSDAGNDVFTIYNATNQDGRFVPGFGGATFSNAAATALLFKGVTSAGNDTGTQPLVIFVAGVTDSESDPFGGAQTAATTRPLFRWQDNESNSAIDIAANRNVGIGTTSPYAKLSVVGEVVASHFTATTTATSTFGGSLAVTEVATSSFAGGINLTSGCFAINNTCVSGGGSYGDTNVNSYIHASTTIPKTYTANVFTGLQRFTNASSTLFSVFNRLYIGGSATSTLQGDATGTSTLQGFLNVAGTNSTSTFSGGLDVNTLKVTSATASSSFANGINLSAGCFSINNTCVGGGTGSSFAYPFTPTSNYGSTNQATTGIAWFQNGVNASSTSNFVNASTTMLSINGILLSSPVTGSFFAGLNSGSGATYATSSNFIGEAAGTNATNAAYSNIFGQSAGSFSTNASYSNFLGTTAGSFATNASYSNFIGYSAGYFATNASSSNFIGNNAGLNATNANNSTFIGRNAGFNDTVNNVGAGKSSILIGDYTSTGGFSGSVAIGQGTKNSAVQQMNLGNVLFATGIYNGTTASALPTSDGKIGIGTTSPYAKLSVVGEVVASHFTATSSTASIFPYASTTALSNSGTMYNSGALYTGDLSASGTMGVGTNSNSTTLLNLFNSSVRSGIVYSEYGSTASDYTNNALAINRSLGIAPGGTTISGNTAQIYDTSFLSLSGTNAISMTSNLLNLSRNPSPGSSDTLTISGALLNISDTCTPILGTCVSTADTIRAMQNSTINTGSALNVSTASNDNIGAYALRVNDDGTFTDSTPFVVDTGGNVGVGTTTPYAKLSVVGEVVASHFTATSTATSTFGGSLAVTEVATSSFAGGINITSGCFAINNTCVGGGSGPGGGVTSVDASGGTTGLTFTGGPITTSGTLTLGGVLTVANGGTGWASIKPGYIPFGNNGSAIATSTNFFWDSTNSRLGIGTTSPMSMLAVAGLITANNINATSTTATSTFSGGLVGNGLSIFDNLEIGNFTFDVDAGAVSWMDLPISSSAPLGTVESYSAQIDSNSLFTIYGEANGSGGLTKARSVFGTTTNTVLTSTNIPFGSVLISDGALCVDNGAGNTCATSARTRGGIYAETSSVSGLDLAEIYPTVDPTLGAGELLMLDPERKEFVKRYTATASSTPELFGVVSSDPGLVLGGFTDDKVLLGTKVPIALAGRVPVKIGLENGPIKIGDQIAPSSVPGVAMKAGSTSEMTIGSALENFDVTSTSTSISVFVDVRKTHAQQFNSMNTRLTLLETFASSTRSTPQSSGTTTSTQSDDNSSSHSTETASVDMASVVEAASTTATAAAISAVQNFLASTTVMDSIASSSATALATSTSFISALSTMFTQIITSIKEWVVDKITARLAVIDRVETKTVTVQKGFEILDQATNEIYCVIIRNGQWDMTLGGCDEPVVTDTLTDDFVEEAAAAIQVKPAATTTPAITPATTTETIINTEDTEISSNEDSVDTEPAEPEIVVSDPVDTAPIDEVSTEEELSGTDIEESASEPVVESSPEPVTESEPAPAPSGGEQANS